MTTLDPATILAATRAAIPRNTPYDNRDTPLLLGGVLYHATWEQEGVKGPFTAGWIWEQRHGKPYQKALESHVEEYAAAQRILAVVEERE